MLSHSKRFGLAAVLALAIPATAVNAAFYGYPRSLGAQTQRIAFATPALAPMAFTRFCLHFPGECKPSRMAFRKPTAVALTEQRWSDLNEVNRTVNRAIIPVRNEGGLLTESWLVAPKSGDCNDYAVTKRHQLLARGWAPRSLLLAEVVVPSGEHHLVLVVHTREGDLVLDNLNANIRHWSQTRYDWVRIQSPKNPHFWSSISRSTA